MKNISHSAPILCAFSLLTTFFSGHAWDWSPKKFLYGWWLIHPIKSVVQAGSEDKKCNRLLREDIQREIVLKNYATPSWVSMLSKLPQPKEAWFDYAYDIYKEIQLEMIALMNAIDGKDIDGKEIDDKDKIDKTRLTEASQTALYTQQAAWRALEEQKLNHVIGEAAVSFRPEDEKEFEEQILKNLKAAIAILDALIPVLGNLTFAQQPQPITSIHKPKSTIRTPNIPAYQDIAAQKEKSAEEVAQFQEGQRNLDLKKEKLRSDANGARIRLSKRIGKDECGNNDQFIKKRLSWTERWHRNMQVKWLKDYVDNVCRACKI